MPLITADAAPRFELHGAAFTGLASPSRGSTANAVWIVTLSDTGAAVPHTLTHEETFVCIEGRAIATLDGEIHELSAGGALVVPACVEFSIRNPDPTPFRAVAVLPVGGQACIAGGAPFTPPWAH